MPPVLATYAEWSPALPDSTTASIALLRLPESGAVPEPIRGQVVAHVRVASVNMPAETERQLAAIRAVGSPLLDTVYRLPTSASARSIEIRTLGGAVARQAPVPNAVGGRLAAHNLSVYAASDPALSDAERLAAVRSVLGSVARSHAPVELIHFVGRANDADAVLRSWSPGQSNRLDTIRSQHDPAGMLPFGRHET